MVGSLPQANDLDATWLFVEPGLQRIIGGSDDDSGVTAGMYMNVYSAVYNYCVNKSRSPGNLDATQGSQSSLLVGAEIYEKLKTYLENYVMSLEKKPTESFLDFYVKRWTRYTVGAGYLNHVFDYMNRYWVQKERSDGRRDIFDVNTLALLTWRDKLFEPHKQTLKKEMLEEIKKQRENQAIEEGVLSTAIRSLVLLGIDVQDLKKPNLQIYVDNFEEPFLEATREYYSHESSEYLASHNVVDYMKKAEQRLNEEESRETMYLDDHSKKPLTDVLNEVLIVAHKDIMANEFQNLLDQNEIEHISKMFKLFARVPSTLDPLAEIFRQYVETQGMTAVENLKNDLLNEAAKAQATVGEGGPAPKKKTSPVDPKQYVKILIQVHSTYKQIVDDAFQNHATFVQALDRACRSYINNNTLSKPTTAKGTSKTPEILAKYSDNLLKKNKDSDAVSGMSIDDIMTVFKFLTDKDAFEVSYRRLLAKRLIHQSSASDEQEEAVIQRLQQENSHEFTSKITKMFQDVRQSAELKTAFKEEMNKDTSGTKYVSEFEPFILTETMWPFRVQPTNFQLPADLNSTYSKFEEMYAAKHSGRLLKWLWYLSRGDLKCNLQKPGRAPFLLSCTLFQMAILLAFNEKESYTLSELCEVTKLEVTHVANCVVPMVKGRLLVQSPSGSENLDKPDTKFTVVNEFKSKRVKVNLLLGVKSSDTKQEEEDTEREINDDRKNFLNACIVRTMKARKSMSHSALLNEVVQQSHTRFTAKVSDIKKCIDQLVEAEYLERNEDQSYNYLA